MRKRPRTPLAWLLLLGPPPVCSWAGQPLTGWEGWTRVLPRDGCAGRWAVRQAETHGGWAEDGSGEESCPESTERNRLALEHGLCHL